MKLLRLEALKSFKEAETNRYFEAFGGTAIISVSKDSSESFDSSQTSDSSRTEDTSQSDDSCVSHDVD